MLDETEIDCHRLFLLFGIFGTPAKNLSVSDHFCSIISRVAEKSILNGGLEVI